MRTVITKTVDLAEVNRMRVYKVHLNNLPTNDSENELPCRSIAKAIMELPKRTSVRLLMYGLRASFWVSVGTYSRSGPLRSYSRL